MSCISCTSAILSLLFFIIDRCMINNASKINNAKQLIEISSEIRDNDKCNKFCQHCKTVIAHVIPVQFSSSHKTSIIK